MPLSLNTTDQLPVVRGKEIQHCSLNGFQTGLSDAFVQLPAGAHIQVALVSQTRFEQLATATGDHQTLEVIHRSNSANLHPQRFEEISALIQAQLMGGGQEDLVEVAVLETIGGSTVHEIACHYGFHSRNHFARDYRNQFGESPSASLQRASAPGMSVQSVSVAQSPQMAMALR
ncbi:AraC family transcriptional regulator [Synechococcus sp. UW86]|uniref:AraC family transcriptional regulator n=1 Tax=Synechococcus sp. UW86 TaxID=368491 RepID=UPI001FCBEA98|nr:AraC family transcriptional regulator [Synechococcus sp. UW86]